MKKTITTMVLAGVVGGHAAVAAEDGPLEFSGDLRLRHEYIDQDGKEERNRQRYRARLKSKFDVNETVKGEIQIVSGSDDPVSSNESFDGAFSSKGLQLDRAYLKWAVAEGVVLSGGKMAQPWMLVSDLVWDGDVTPEGINGSVSLGEEVKLMANAGYFWLDELSETTSDRVLYTGQVGAELAVAEGVSLLVGGSVYSYDNMKGLAPLVDATDGFGNTVIETIVDPLTGESTFAYATDFLIYEGFAQLKTAIGGLPLALLGNIAVNDEADAEDTGYLVGLKVGKVKEPGQVEGSILYIDKEADAVLGALTDSDFGGGGTGAEGFKLGGKVGIAPNWTGGLTVLLNQLDPDDSDTDYTRVQVDLVAVF